MKIRVLISIVLLFCFSGCSVFMAASGEKQKDTSILFEGIPRLSVLEKLGKPHETKTLEDGTLQDTWYIKKGRTPSAPRAVCHAVLDVCSLGIWEAVGTPIELVEGRENLSRYVVNYDKNEKVTQVQTIVPDSKEKKQIKEELKKKQDEETKPKESESK